METEKELIFETEKWLEKINKEMPKIKETKENSQYIKNINAYISDTKHFINQKKYVLAFEAIVWAWAWLQIMQELKIINT